jgi:hypothetical protein
MYACGSIVLVGLAMDDGAEGKPMLGNVGGFIDRLIKTENFFKKMNLFENSMRLY